MRRIDYKEWKSRKPEIFRKLIEVENSFQGRVPGRRPRDPEKEQVLLRLDKARLARYIETGKIEILGPRRIKWRVDFRKG